MRKIVLALVFLGLIFCNMGNASGQTVPLFSFGENSISDGDKIINSPTNVPIFSFGASQIPTGDQIITPPVNVPIFGFGISEIPVGDMIITPPTNVPLFSFGESSIPVSDKIITPPADVTFGFGEAPLFGNTQSPQPDQSPIFGFGR